MGLSGRWEARGFDADFFEQAIAAPIFQGHAVDKDFGNGLDREFAIAVADLKNPPIEGNDADGKLIRVSFCQFGDVAGDFACVQPAIVVVQSF